MESKWLSYYKQINKAYNKKVRPRTFVVGDLVLKAARYVPNGLNATKFMPIPMSGWHSSMLNGSSFTTTKHSKYRLVAFLVISIKQV